MIVASDGSGQFTSIQEAIDSIPEDNKKWITIQVKAGIYEEKLVIKKPFIALEGTNRDEVKVVYGDYAQKIMPNGESMGTFSSYSFLVTTDHFVAKHITFVNNAGPGSEVGQAVAAYIDGDQLEFHHCSFVGSQDTLFTGPLPPKPIEGVRFGGPKDSCERRVGRSYFYDCYIEGDIDFIFGSATSVFSKCEIYSIDRKNEVNGYITAASTPVDEEYGYIFIDCRLISDAAPETVYLGRPWRDYAKTAFINCWMGEHIKAEGWHNWDKEHAEQTTSYVEYNSHGPGGSMDNRVKWAKTLTANEAEKYRIDQVFHVDENWRGWREEKNGK
ncbi:pectinesterase family protein [Ferdinandcohnia quinoae]|uniref:Pectinesterase n=1 Tax=Fredinandcohnia quinoae TaxID=2918902 RepID=A0AAW5E5X5_9BACI|nr:pectinesterase family protein [Fredinandcohnia sp. SECRCQ15]MCH1625452.1 pectinesterase family protein [Fredinandcohnia sp. SECRCQ15]